MRARFARLRGEPTPEADELAAKEWVKVVRDHTGNANDQSRERESDSLLPEGIS